MAANDRQVAGDHYKNGYQHWDFVTNVGMGYLAGQVTKYLKRWKNKNGLEDIDKAGHFLDKMIEVAPILIQQRASIPATYINSEVDIYIYSNAITGPEANVT